MIKHTVLFVIFIVLNFALAQAQDEGEIIIETSDNSEIVKPPYNTNRSIKVNPILLLRGDFPLYLEQPAGKRMSLEVGGGVTHGDYLRVIFPQYDSYLWLHDFNSFSYRPGYSARASVRIYLSTLWDQPEGHYISASARRVEYRILLQDCIAGAEDRLAKTIHTEGGVIYGYVDYFSENFYFDYYFGASVRQRVQDSFECDMSSGQTEQSIRYLPFLNFGVKIGFNLQKRYY